MICRYFDVACYFLEFNTGLLKRLSNALAGNLGTFALVELKWIDSKSDKSLLIWFLFFTIPSMPFALFWLIVYYMYSRFLFCSSLSNESFLLRSYNLSSSIKSRLSFVLMLFLELTFPVSYLDEFSFDLRNLSNRSLFPFNCLGYSFLFSTDSASLTSYVFSFNFFFI